MATRDSEQQREPASGSRLPKRANRVGGSGGGQRRVDRAGLVPAAALREQPAVGVDHRGDAGRRRAHDRQPFLDRAQPRLREMLRRAPAAEPGVVRRIEDEVAGGARGSTTWPEKMIS